MLLLGLDVGTTGCKAVLVDPESGPVSRSFREYGIDSDGAGKAEQDAEQVWELAKTVMREALAAGGAREVAAVCSSVQGDAIIPLGAGGRPIAPAVLGMDYRCLSEMEDCGRKFDGFELFRRTGMRPHPINSFLKMLWLRRAKPDIFSAAAGIATYSDFVMGRMGCPGAIDACMASRSMAFNLADGGWDEEVLSAFDFPRSLLPGIIPSGTPAGKMSREAAREIGLDNQPLVVAGGHDQPVAAIGAGAVTPDIAVASTGTAEVMSRFLAAPVLARGMHDSYYPCYCSAMGRGYFTFSLNHVGGLALRWFRDKWCGEEVAAAAASGKDAYDIMVEAMPTGPSGMFVLPHFTGSGTPDCDFASRAAFVGMTLATDRPTAGLALLEGITYELRRNLDRMRELGMATSRVRNVGGGSRSARWAQLKADILGVPVDVMATADAACIGAAVLAGTGAGAFASVEEGVSRLVRIAGTFEPDSAASARYADAYRVYGGLHGALAPFYRSMG